MDEIDRYIYIDGHDDFLVDLFPYKIKNADNFYFRKHPEGLNPNSFNFKTYWGAFGKSCVEGKWVNDAGTWVYMMPKLFFYVNYVTISDEKRERINPRLMDNMWIMFTYFLCCEGFSGFEDDDKYTCNKYVGKLQKGEKLQPYELRKLELSNTVKTKSGEYKQYIDPWIYLTETYLITDNRKTPLGNPLYENGYYHMMILSARATFKSYTVFMGLFLHEWLFGSVRKYKDIKNSNNALLFGIASPQSDALARSIGNLDRAYFSFPGQYDFPTKKKGKTVKYWGAFYKNTRGQWKVDKGANEVRHLVKTKQGKTIINGSQCQIQTITPKNDKIFTGDRFRYGIIEEVGFCDNLKNIFVSCKDAFEVGDDQTGSLVMLGTGGDMEKIKDSKEMFENPEAFNIFGIPNYWEKGKNKKCGLMLGANYKKESLKKDGNTIQKEALIDIIRTRSEQIVSLDVVSYARYLAYNPIYPKELLKPVNKSPLPLVELSAQRESLIEHDAMNLLSVVGSLKYKDSKVIFEPDLERTLEPILEWGRDEKLTNTVGAWVIHEMPQSFIPDDLYYILYDPYRQSGEGTSLQAIYVYKYKFKSKGNDNTLEDTIVASYVGRLKNLDDSYEEAIKASYFFNAKVFPEMNVTGFAEFVDRRGLRDRMMYIPKSVLEPIKGSTASSHGRSHYGYGVKVNYDMNIWSIHRVAEWFSKAVEVDEKTGIPKRFNYQNVRDLRLLSEASNFNFDNKSDYDAMSALMLLPYLLSYLDGIEVEMPDQYETMLEMKYNKYALPNIERPKILVSKLSQTI
ncbi:MAG: hypothetical protein KBH21_00075 [Acetoanaerobium sp.]|nr:hypothetical protein [Acetoanaerobium sp.]